MPPAASLFSRPKRGRQIVHTASWLLRIFLPAPMLPRDQRTMSQTAVPELAQPTTAKRGSTGSTVLRVIIAAAVIGGIAWYVHSRHHERTTGTDSSAAATPHSGSDGKGGKPGAGGGSAESRVVTVQIAPV